MIARPECALAKSSYVERFIPLGTALAADHDESFVADLAATELLGSLDNLGDWIIVAEDKELRLLAESDLPESVLSRLLPARNALGISLIDSTVGLAEALTQLNIAQPRSRVAATRGELEAILRAEDCALLIKADSGHGGTCIARALNPKDFDSETIDAAWFPVVVQEFVDGDLCAVEAQFVNGQLVGYLYSTVLQTFSLFGNSTDRLFTAPPDNQVEVALSTLGDAGGLHGLANCSFMLNSKTGELLLIEVDMRPNIWHQYGPKLGVDWVALYKSPPSHPVHNEGSQMVANYPRSLARALKHRDRAILWKWITRQPGTWDMRNKKDLAINRSELRSIYRDPLRNAFHKASTAFRKPKDKKVHK